MLNRVGESWQSRFGQVKLATPSDVRHLPVKTDEKLKADDLKDKSIVATTTFGARCRLQHRAGSEPATFACRTGCCAIASPVLSVW